MATEADVRQAAARLQAELTANAEAIGAILDEPIAVPDHVVLTSRIDRFAVNRSPDFRHVDVLGPMTRAEASRVVRDLQAHGDLALLRPLMAAWPEEREG